MTLEEVMTELESFGDPQTKKTLLNHGAKEPFFGVKAGDLKKIKKDHELSLALYAAGNTDAMYFAGLIADESQITKEQLNDWAEKAYWYYLSEYTVPWVAAKTPFGLELGLEWIESDQAQIAAAGWGCLAYYAGVNEDENLDFDLYSKLLDRVSTEIHDQPNRVRYVMNGFVISTGS